MPRRRANGEGGVYYRKKERRWQGCLQRPGMRPKYLYAKTQAELLEKMRAVRAEIERGGARGDDRRTFGEFLADWLEAKKPALEAGSWVRYEGFIRLHVAPALGGTRLPRLTPAQLQRHYARLLDKLAPKTVIEIHASVIKPALKQAVRWGMIPSNPAEAVDLPKRQKPTRRVFTPEQMREFIAAIRGDRLEALYALALTTGMRQGELLGLRWADVDLARGVLTVTQQWKRDYAGRKIGPPKSESGTRQIALPSAALDALRRRKVAQAEERLRAGRKWQDRGLIFTSGVGTALNPNYMRDRKYYPLLEAAGLPRLVFHELRHSAATFLIESGVPLAVVSEILGHSSIRITVDLYGHLTVDSQRGATTAFEGLLREESQ